MAGSMRAVAVGTKHQKISMPGFAPDIRNLTPPYTPSEDEGHGPPKVVRNHPNGLTIDQAEDLHIPTRLEVPDDGDPIVIVGIACRLPGGVSSPHELWKMLLHEKSGQCDVPKERFNVDGFYHPEGDRAGAMNTRGGYFIREDIRQFENTFFGVSNIEATYMDPQQRKLLEVVYECFESSGTSLKEVAGANIGVYVGNFTVDFQTMQTREPEYLHRYSATGSGTAILANRLSYIFDLKGPSFTLDTACSSSIYCLHNAVVALQNGDCDAAIVAGANLITAPEQHLGTMKGGVLSPTSTCHTFDASADGYGRAEGISALYVKRLSTALRDGDPIRAVVRATAINANGKTSGITQPSISGQEEVIRKAYRKAGLALKDTAYVECHGTGTGVGDPMEVEALSKVFSRHRASPLLLGAVKTNLGHSEAASGISSVIKAVLAFEHKLIPATIGVQRLNPKLHLDEWNMQIVTKPTEWPSKLHRASINSFGYGGANAHAILESVDSYLPWYRHSRQRRAVKDPSKLYVLPFSASTTQSLEARVNDIAERMAEGTKYDLGDLCHTLADRRTKLSEKGFVLATEASAKIDITVNKLVTPKSVSPSLNFGFVFTGQGAQWPQMGVELFARHPSFVATINHLDSVLQSLPESPQWMIKDVLLDPASISRINQAEFSQPLCTAVQVGIVKLLRVWGVRPTVVVGHSSGEIAAAFAAGLLTEAQSIIIAFYRGYAVSQITSDGSMLAAGMGPDSAEAMIDDLALRNEVCVACVNSPESVTLSGNSRDIDSIMVRLHDRNIFAKKLATGGRGYHSVLMKEIGAQYEDLVSKALAVLPISTNQTDRSETLQPARLFSSVGKDSDVLATFTRDNIHSLSPHYWRANLESPVQFSGAVKNLIASGSYHLIEIGPHPALQLPIKQIRSSLGLLEINLPYSATLVRGKNADVCMKSLAGELYLSGHAIDFIAVNDTDPPDSQDGSFVIHDLPPYRWSYTQLLWKEPRSSIELRNRTYVRHELLGSEVVAANGIERCWRNILKTSETPWMGDHLLESQVVFPAAGYLAMAMEAISQIKRWFPTQNLKPYFSFRNVNISSALVVQDGDQETELFTMVYEEKISTASTSTIWYTFSISSVQNGTSVSHCVGSVSVSLLSPPKIQGVTVDTVGYEKWSMNNWYEKLASEGLRFGSAFQNLTSMRTDSARIKPAAVSTTKLFQRVPNTEGAEFPGTYYTVHPLVIDACLQAAIMGGTAGSVEKLKAFLPTFFERVDIITPDTDRLTSEAFIHSQSRTTGFNTKKINVTLRDEKENAIIDISEARLSLYAGKIDDDTNASELNRHPCLRVVWKPDVTRLNESCKPDLEAYLEQFISDHHGLSESYSDGVVAGLMDLAGHKNPRLRILEVGRNCECKSRQILEILDYKTAFSRLREWQTTTYSDGCIHLEPRTNSEGSAKVKLEPDVSAQYDLLLMLETGAMDEMWLDIAMHLPNILSPQGIVIGKKSTKVARSLRSSGFEVFDLVGGIMLAVPRQRRSEYEGKEILFIERSTSQSLLTTEVRARFSDMAGGATVRRLHLEDLEHVEIDPKTLIVSLLELEKPILPSIISKEMDLLRRITDKVTELIWVTGATNLDGCSPDLTLANGLSRALMIEQPALRFVILDVGNYLDVFESDRISIFRDIQRVFSTEDNPDDKEFASKAGLLHISRFVPDHGLNRLFSQRRNQETCEMTLEVASPARLAIKKVGIMDSIYFQQEREVATAIPRGQVDVDVKAVSLNAKDIYVLSGKVETQKGTSAIEFSGVIRAVADDVHDLRPGDRVCVLAPNSFRTTERVPAWACHKMLPEESFEVMPTLPVIYGTALYALDDRAQLRPGETILIHSGAGAFGQASIAIAQQRGATVYTTVSTEQKKDYLVSELGLPRDHIFQSRDISFVDGIMAATNGKGVNVVLNSLTGDLLHASWRCCANFGRFVEVGKRDILDAGKLDMDVFFRNVTFTAFDLTELFYHEEQFYRDIWINKSREALELYRAGAVRPVPIRTFDVSQITQAYRHFSQKDRVGKIVISMQNSQSLIKAVPAKYLTTFSPTKSYILVGCLGGLGRSLSKWMFNRGARHFTFLGRSATDKAAAKEVVQNLENAGAAVQVVRGDVINKEDVERCFTASPRPIGGVIQAAMGLHEALFSTMTNKAWHTGIQPKWQGTWNLHNALEGKDDQLDFFLMTSSVSGSVGTATESNYCSANGFLDAFARYRYSLGKPVSSIGFGMISEVGYLHENPEIEALLLRKGIQPLNEDEFLQILDLSLSGDPSAKGMQYDKLAKSHILTGLEQHGIRKMMTMGFDVTSNATIQDARSSLLAASLDSEAGDDSIAPASIHAAWSTGLPSSVVKALAAEASGAASLNDAILALVSRRFSNLLLMPLESVDTRKPIGSYGMDSMIAAEYRSWFWSVFKVDVPFLDILSSTNHLQALTDMIEAALTLKVN